ncbi:MAG TPA: glycosyltransferase family 39 protein [Solirubrobacteraceae bacterium]
MHCRALISRAPGSWRGRRRDEKLTLVASVTLVTGAVVVRVWLMLGYGPALLGFGDSHEYVDAAATGVFSDPQKPAGYPIFLRVVNLFDDRLGFTIAVQHALGIAAGLLLYKAVRRTGAPAWLGLVPAAVAFFGAGGPLLEHSLLADSLFAFLQAVAVYAAVRALGESGLRWALLAGVAAGAGFWVKTIGLSSAMVIPLLLLLAASGNVRHRLASAAAVAVAALVLILAYPAVQGVVTGYWGYERQGAWNLYGRVATFVDCSTFDPPAGTGFLCPDGPPAHRQSESFYQYARASPAVRRFGGPAHAPSNADALLQRFSVAAIEHQPLAYADAILHGLTFFVSARAGEGYTPSSLREALLDQKGVLSVDPAISHFFRQGDRGYVGHGSSTRALVYYDDHSQVQGGLLILLLLAAVVGVPLLGSRDRAAAAMCALVAIASVTLAVAGNSYDARYGYPAAGPLAAGAALGAWGIWARVSRVLNKPRGKDPPTDMEAAEPLSP